MREPSRRVQFLTDLASVVDRDTDAELRHGDLLANNTAVAALREEVEVLAATLGQAGADFVPSIDFERRLQEELSARRAGRPHRQDSQELTVPTLALPEFASDPPPAAEDNPLAVVDFGRPPPGAILSGAKPPRPRRGAHPIWIFTLLLTIAVAGALALAGPDGRENLAAHVDNAGATVRGWLSPAEPPEPVPKVPPPRPLSRFLLEQVVGPTEELSGFGEAAVRPGAALPIGIPIETGPRSQITVQTKSGVRVTLGPQSQLTPSTTGQLDLRGAARVDLGPEETVLALPNATLAGKDASLLVQADDVHSQVAVLRGGVRLDPPQAQALDLRAFQTATLAARGAPVVAPLTDTRSLLAALAPPEATPGQLTSPELAKAAWPTRHEFAIELQADLALVTVTEQFPPAGATKSASYALPLPPFASLVEAPQVLSGGSAGEGERSGARGSAALHGLQRDGGPLRVRTRYLLPIVNDGRGPHLRYGLQLAQNAPPLTIAGEASLLESGTLTSSAVPKGGSGRRFELADRSISQAFELRIDVKRPQEPEDGRVLWASGRGPLSTGEHWEPGSDAHDHAAALVRISPLIASVLSGPSQALVLVDHSRGMAPFQQTAQELLASIRHWHGSSSRLHVRYCQLECSEDAPSGTPAGSFDLGAALQSSAPLIQPPPAAPVHILILTARGPGTGDLEPPAALEQATISTVHLGTAPSTALTAFVRTHGGLQIHARGPIEAQEAALQWLRSFVLPRAEQARMSVSKSEHGRAQFERELGTLLAGTAQWVPVPGRAADGATAQLYANLGEGQAPLTRDYVLGHYPPTFASSPFNALLQARSGTQQTPTALPPPLSALTSAGDERLIEWSNALLSRITERAPAAHAKRPQILRPKRLVEIDLEGLKQDQQTLVRATCGTAATTQCLNAVEGALGDTPWTHAFHIYALARAGLREAAWAGLSDLMDAYESDAGAQASYAHLLLQASHVRAGCSHARRAHALDPSLPMPTGCGEGEAPLPDETNSAASTTDLRVSARWAESDAFDLVLTDAQGRSISWLSALAKEPLGEVTDPFAAGRETLTVENLPSGLYQLTLVATEQSGDSGPQTVRVEIHLKKERRVFSLRPEVVPGGQIVAFLRMP